MGIAEAGGSTMLLALLCKFRIISIDVWFGSKVLVKLTDGGWQLECNAPLSDWTRILARTGHFWAQGASRFAKTVSTEHQ